MSKDKEKEIKKLPIEKIENVEITDELKQSYLDYAMSVIVGRALPDVRDGLKPVHRRILWTMWEEGLTHQAKLRKSATVVGGCLGRYHPHGEIAIYDALVRMAQDFSLRYPLVDGQGNFGSLDGDSAAAMRYTECRLAKITGEILTDIEKETVDWQSNYDNTRKEPKVMPAKIPNLLLGGSMGIAVGMATNIPPHNLSEVIDASIYLIETPGATSEDLMKFIQGPDFPTGGVIYNKKDIIEAYNTGRGSIVVRGLVEVSEKQIIITEIPYQVNKAELIIRIADLVQNKKIEGIKDVRDESDKDGLRIVIDLKSDAVPQKILNSLYSFTDLQKDFHLNVLALVDGIRPEILSIRDILSIHLNHRQEVVRRRAEFDLKKTKERAHILEGLYKALSIIDKVIALIRKSANRGEAHKGLVKNFKLTDLQAEAILEMKLHTLAALETKKIEEELKEKKKLIEELETLLKNPKAILRVIKEEYQEIKEKYGDERRTKVVVPGLTEFNKEDFIPQESAVITLSQNGYIKRLAPQMIKSQQRGGKGVIGSEVSEEDILKHFISADTHDNILFFTEKGRVFQTKVYEIPLASRTAKGKTIQNFLAIPAEEKISAVVSYPSFGKDGVKKSDCLMMATRKGLVKKTSLEDFMAIRKNGIIAITLQKGDALIDVKLSSGKDEAIITTKKGQAIRFKESQIRRMGRTASGVKGINLATAKISKEILTNSGDEVASFDVLSSERTSANLLSVMSNGFAKQTSLKQYKIQSRGGRGIKTALITSKTGHLVTSKIITNQTDLIMISGKGQLLRMEIKNIRTSGRASQGVKIIKLNSGDSLAGIVCI